MLGRARSLPLRRGGAARRKRARRLRSSLAEALQLDVAVLVDHDQLTLHTAGDREDDPDDAPDQAREDRQDRVKRVIDRLAGREHRLELALRLDPPALDNAHLY